MTIRELNNELKKSGVSENKYFLHGLFGSTDDDNKVALTIKKGQNTDEYEVYYKELGEKHSSRTFNTEAEACEYILNKFKKNTRFFNP
ncbi:hypothetical protein E5167_14295 [Pontimicrobium aquaticum]|uniref:Uncharacterized protein n=1 Tax=Pontimicrobium aquaticum TaxID=2565367 RepID=A0A4U0EM73_9FLAO|nr:hypothetical protein E5167_14295 [Pontimicrobium aquaticum]